MNHFSRLMLCGLSALMTSASALGQAQAWVETNGNTVYVRANTCPIQQICDYSIAVTLANGMRLNTTGQTGPVTRASNHVAALWTYTHVVTSATLVRWDCTAKR